MAEVGDVSMLFVRKLDNPKDKLNHELNKFLVNNVVGNVGLFAISCNKTGLVEHQLEVHLHAFETFAKRCNTTVIFGNMLISPKTLSNIFRLFGHCKFFSLEGCVFEGDFSKFKLDEDQQFTIGLIHFDHCVLDSKISQAIVAQIGNNKNLNKSLFCIRYAQNKQSPVKYADFESMLRNEGVSCTIENK